MTIKAVLFDIDGTLLDTTEFILQAFEHSLHLHKLPLKTREIISSVIGKHLKECYQLLTGLEIVDHLISSHKEFQKNNYHLARAFSDTEATLQKLRDKGIKIVAITTRYGPSIPETLQLNNIYHFFDLILTADDVKEVKPDPEGIFKALKYLKIKPSEAVMVGDAPADIEAGKNAKVKTIAVTFGFHKEKIINSKPDLIVNKLSDIIRIIYLL